MGITTKNLACNIEFKVSSLTTDYAGKCVVIYLSSWPKKRNNKNKNKTKQFFNFP